MLQSNSDFTNKIKERSNTPVIKPNVTIRLRTLFITNFSTHIDVKIASGNINHHRLFKGNKQHQALVMRVFLRKFNYRLSSVNGKPLTTVVKCI